MKYSALLDPEDGTIPTKNQTGFMMTTMEGASPLFVDAAAECDGVIVDLACAYGVATQAVLRGSKASVIAMDLEQQHLDVLVQAISTEEKKRLRCFQCHFPTDFNLAKDSVDLLHCSHMFHFLTGEEIQDGLKKILLALKPGGQMFLNTVTPFFKPVSGALSAYQARKQAGENWPGVLTNLQALVSKEDSDKVPPFLHVFEIEDFVPLVEAAGFKIEQAFYYDILSVERFSSDGKAAIGIVARKD